MLYICPSKNAHHTCFHYCGILLMPISNRTLGIHNLETVTLLFMWHKSCASNSVPEIKPYI